METPRDIIHERQRVLGAIRQRQNLDAGLPAGPEKLSQADMHELTKRFTDGPISASTVSRWQSNNFGVSDRKRLEVAAWAWCDPDMPAEKLLSRLELAFGFVNDNTELRQLPKTIDDLTDAQWRLVLHTIDVMSKENRNLIVRARGGHLNEDDTTAGNGNGGGVSQA